jgi:hypothetical protein
MTIRRWWRKMSEEALQIALGNVVRVPEGLKQQKPPRTSYRSNGAGRPKIPFHYRWRADYFPQPTRSSKLYRPNGDRECARRRRQALDKVQTVYATRILTEDDFLRGFEGFAS